MKIKQKIATCKCGRVIRDYNKSKLCYKCSQDKDGYERRKKEPPSHAEKQMDKFIERLINKKIIRRKVVCVYGKFGEKSDFVIEPVCFDGCKCDGCKNSFYIEGEVEK